MYDFIYQAASWSKPRRVVARVEWHQGELFPNVGFILTNMSAKAKGVVHFYNGRGTAEQWIKEGKYALNWTRLSCKRFVSNQVRLWLFVLAYNLEYFYTITAFSKPDTVTSFPSQESSKSGNALSIVPGTAAPQTVGEVAVVPNPYRADISYSEYNPPWERPGLGRQRWVEQDRKIQFINIPDPCKILIYSLAGDLIQTIHYSDPERGFANWNLTSSVGQTVASGIYLYSVEDKKNEKIQVGKFVVIK